MREKTKCQRNSELLSFQHNVVSLQLCKEYLCGEIQNAIVTLDKILNV